MIKVILYCFIIFVAILSGIAMITIPLILVGNIRWKKEKKRIQEEKHCPFCKITGRIIDRIDHWSIHASSCGCITWKVDITDTFRCDSCNKEWKIEWKKYISEKKHLQYGLVSPSDKLRDKIKNDLSVYLT